MYYLLLVVNFFAFTAYIANTLQYLDDSHIGKPCNTVKEQWLDRAQPCKKGYYCKQVNCTVSKIVRYGCYNSSFYPSDKQLRCEREPACPWKPEGSSLSARSETEDTTTTETSTHTGTTINPLTTPNTPVDTTTTHLSTTVASITSPYLPTTTMTMPTTTLGESTTGETTSVESTPSESSTANPTNTPTEPPESENPTDNHKKCEKLMEGIEGRYLFRHDANCQTYWECKWKPFLQQRIIVDYSCMDGTIFNEQEQECVNGTC